MRDDITLTCPSCGHTGRAPASKAGRTVTCPKCRTQFAVVDLWARDHPAGVPAPPGQSLRFAGQSLRFDCPHCGAGIKAREDQAGRQFPCPGCRKAIAVPDQLELDFGDDSRPRRRSSAPWGGGEMALFVVMTVLFPIVGIVMGIIDLTYDRPRKNQGGVLLALGIGMCVVYAAALGG